MKERLLKFIATPFLSLCVIFLFYSLYILVRTETSYHEAFWGYPTKDQIIEIYFVAFISFLLISIIGHFLITTFLNNKPKYLRTLVIPIPIAILFHLFITPKGFPLFIANWYIYIFLFQAFTEIIKRLLLNQDELIGEWSSDDGSGFIIIMSAWIKFDENGTGTYTNFCAGDEEMGDINEKEHFKWQRLNDHTITISLNNKEEELIEYKTAG